MSAVIAEALDSGVVRVVTLVDIDHPNQTYHFWNGLGDLDYAGFTYGGLGSIGSINPIETNTEVQVTEVRFSISGVDPDVLEGLGSSVKGREAQVYEAWLDENYRVAYAELLLEARLDYQTYSVDPESGKASINLVAHTGFFHLLNRSGSKVSPEEAKAIDPDETGFDEMHKQQDEQLIWRPA